VLKLLARVTIVLPHQKQLTTKHSVLMKTQKNLISNSQGGFLLGLVVLTLIALLFSSCNDDDEKGPDTRAAFVGNYDVEDISSSSGYVYNYEMSIKVGANGELEISNFADMFNVPVKATVDGMNLTIKKQTFTNPSGKSISVSGSGTLQNNILSFTYTTTGYLNYTGTCKGGKL